MLWHQLPEARTVFDVDLKGFKVPVVDPDHPGACLKGRADLCRVVGLHQGGQAQSVGNADIFRQGFCVKERADQQNSVCPDDSGLVNLIGVNGKILSDNRNAHRPLDSAQIIVTA
ncbi:hypothetical protein SDC9_190755 [bioreactor metagenome]|uniref:Uncharacterized protein n=1 Tax=bioreactor metagenome TaxID=1076179 RepID=A0A645HX87_9ZZZZ